MKLFIVCPTMPWFLLDIIQVFTHIIAAHCIDISRPGSRGIAGIKPKHRKEQANFTFPLADPICCWTTHLSNKELLTKLAVGLLPGRDGNRTLQFYRFRVGVCCLDCLRAGGTRAVERRHPQTAARCLYTVGAGTCPHSYVPSGSTR